VALLAGTSADADRLAAATDSFFANRADDAALED
jgi:hypothetical protein